MTEEEPSAKRIKSTDSNDDSNQPLNSEEDLSKSNVKLPNFICEKWYLDAKTADIHFKFEKDDGEIVEVHAHKLVLTTGSNVFRTMFYGSIPEGDEVKIKDVTIAAFQEFLAFFYMEDVTLTLENIEEVIYSIKKYGIERCLKHCVEFLIKKLENDNVCFGYRLAIVFDLDDLKYFCERKISANVEDVIKTECFLNSEWNVFNQILKLDSLVCKEAQVFDAAMKWAENSCEKKGLATDDMQNLRDQFKESIFLIHFQRMEMIEFSPRIAKYNGLFTAPELVDIIQTITSKEFKSNLFTTNPVSDDIFTLDEDHIVECSISDLLTQGSRDSKSSSNQKHELSFSFSVNKPLLLGKIHFTCPMYSGIKIQLIENSKDVFTGNFRNPAPYFKFPKPICIYQKFVYQFKFTIDKDYSNEYYYYYTLGRQEITFEDIEINFGVGGYRFPVIVDAMYLNRL